MNLFKFRLNIFIRIILIIVLGLAAYFFMIETPFFLVSFWLLLFAVILFVTLIRYIERSYRELTNFLLAIKQNDFSTTYRASETHFRPLHEVFNIITNEFKKLSSEKELNFHFLKAIVEHSGVPLLAYGLKNKRVELVNQSMKELLNIPHITKIDFLDRKFPSLKKTIIEMGDNEKVLLKLKIDETNTHLSILSRKIMLYGEAYMIIAIHNIDSELDQKEIESWQRLIRVLTHEIKNSVIPISTLAEVSNQLLQDRNPREMEQEDEEDLKVSIQTIERRSKGLVKFVEAYGSLAKTPKPRLQRVNLLELVNQIVDFQHVECKKRAIILNLGGDSPEVMIDQEMVEQVLINLVKNAMEAIGKNGKIDLNITEKENNVIIAIEDNGPGMDDDTRESIFVPFFTTKEKGSGIGLSLSRQIIKAHKGSIRVYSKPGKGTKFEIHLPKIF